MLASELIQKLKETIEEHGDANVFSDECYPISHVEFKIYTKRDCEVNEGWFNKGDKAVLIYQDN